MLRRLFSPPSALSRPLRATVLAIIFCSFCHVSLAQTLGPDFGADYSLVDLGSAPSVPGPYGGLCLLSGSSDVLLLGGSANNSGGAIYSIALTRDGTGHVDGFSGNASLFATAPYIDGGLTYGASGVLFYAGYPTNQLGQIKPGSSSPDKIIDLSAAGVSSSVGAIQFVAPGFPDAGGFRIVSYNGGGFYTATLAPDDAGTFDLSAVTLRTTTGFGPEGLIYVPSGSPGFASPSVLIAEYGSGRVSAYALDASGIPIPDSRRDFVTGLSGAEGAFIDPQTGDFLFSTFGGGDRVIAVRGFNIPDTCTPPPSGMRNWWPGDGDARDIWGGNSGVLQNGATFAAGEVGQAFALNGVDQFVSVAASAGTDVGGASSAFTVDAWIYPTDDDTNPIVEWSEPFVLLRPTKPDEASPSAIYGVHFWEGYGCLDGCGARGPSSGALYANIVDTNGSSHYVSTDSGVVPLNTWSHVALTYQDQTGDAIIYLNGAVVASANVGSFTPRTNLQLNFGARPISDGGCTGNGCFFGGEIDEVELFDHALARYEILSIFNAGSWGKCRPQCVAPPDGLVAWYPGDGNATDIAGANHGTPENGAGFDSGIVDQAFNFQGAQDVLIGNPNTLRITGSITLDAWINPSQFPENQQLMSIVTKWFAEGVSGDSYGLFLSPDDGGDLFLLGAIGEPNSEEPGLVGGTPIPINAWTHVAMTYNADTGENKIYVNGVLDGTRIRAGGIVDSTTNVYIGREDNTNFPRFFSGNIDEVEIFNRALSAKEIMSIFAARSAGKCKPEQVDVESAFVNKNETFTQTSTADPVPESSPFELVVGVTATGPNNVTSASFFPPPPPPFRQVANNGIPLSSDDGINWSFSSAFSDRQTMDQSFPNGDYAFDIHTAHAPFELTPIVPINGDNYPPTPKIQNNGWSDGALQIDPAQNYTFEWNTFYVCTGCGVADRPAVRQVGEASSGLITLNIRDDSGNTIVDVNVSPFENGYIMPADTLAAGQTYHAFLQFANVTDRNENDVQLSGQYATITKFDIMTTGRVIAPGPASPYYITAGQQGTVTVVQLDQVKQTWSEHHGDPGEYAIAVLDTVRILGAKIDNFSSLGSEYTLAGVFTGRELPAPMGNAAFWDGATDGTHNYSVDYNGGGVYRFDAFWGNPQLLFNTASHYLGITYDQSNNTLWLSQWDNGTIEHRDLQGNVLSSFSVPLTNASCLALDPADGSLWMGSQLNLGTFYQFSQDGTPVTTRAYPTLANKNTLGGEFPASYPTPSPGPSASPGPTPKMTVSVFPATISEGGDATFTVAASNAVSHDIMVNFAMSGKAMRGPDYTLSVETNQVTIPAGSASGSITLHAIADHVAEKNETATLTLQTGQGYVLAGKQKKKASVKITNAP